MHRPQSHETRWVGGEQRLHGSAVLLPRGPAFPQTAEPRPAVGDARLEGVEPSGERRHLHRRGWPGRCSTLRRTSDGPAAPRGRQRGGEEARRGLRGRVEEGGERVARRAPVGPVPRTPPGEVPQQAHPRLEARGARDRADAVVVVDTAGGVGGAQRHDLPRADVVRLPQARAEGARRLDHFRERAGGGALHEVALQLSAEVVRRVVALDSGAGRQPPRLTEQLAPVHRLAPVDQLVAGELFGGAAFLRTEHAREGLHLARLLRPGAQRLARAERNGAQRRSRDYIGHCGGGGGDRALPAVGLTVLVQLRADGVGRRLLAAALQVRDRCARHIGGGCLVRCGVVTAIQPRTRTHVGARARQERLELAHRAGGRAQPVGHPLAKYVAGRRGVHQPP